MSDRDTVVEFPETGMLQWRPYERCLRELWNGTGRHSPEMIDDMLGRLRPVFLRHFQRASEHPGTLPDAGDQIARAQAWMLEFAVGLLSEIAEREHRLACAGIS